MHLNNLVVAIKEVGGKTLRESSIWNGGSNLPHTDTRGGTIYLPFGKEYEIFLKNQSSRRALISVSIDGMEALGSAKIVLGGYENTTLERFILDGNMLKGRRFKFVQKDSPEVSNPGSSDIGKVVVKCQWEKAQIVATPTIWPFWTMPSGSNDWWQPSHRVYGPMFYYGTSHYTNMDSSKSIGSSDPQVDASFAPTVSSRSSGEHRIMTCSMGVSSNTVGSFIPHEAPAEAQKGATVEGSESKQQFSRTTIGELEENVTELQFQILAPKQDVSYTVIDTKEKYCQNCGLQIPGDAKYCPKCGTKQAYLA